MNSLKDFKFVDLKKSKFDKTKAKPTEGLYHFSEKHYLKNTDYADPVTRPRHVLSWVRFAKESDFIEYKTWQYDLQAESVNVADGLYWPEPLSPKPDGTYQWKDSILMQVPFEIWMAKRKADRDRYDLEAQNNRKAFKDLAASEGASVDMDDDIYRKVGI